MCESYLHQFFGDILCVNFSIRSYDLTKKLIYQVLRWIIKSTSILTTYDIFPSKEGK